MPTPNGTTKPTTPAPASTRRFNFCYKVNAEGTGFKSYGTEHTGSDGTAHKLDYLFPVPEAEPKSIEEEIAMVAEWAVVIQDFFANDGAALLNPSVLNGATKRMKAQPIVKRMKLEPGLFLTSLVRGIPLKLLPQVQAIGEADFGKTPEGTKATKAGKPAPNTAALYQD